MYTMIGLALLVGIAIGATAVSQLHAQGKSPAPVYVVTDFSEITDVAALNAGAKHVLASLDTSGGKIIAISDNAIALEGTPPRRVGITTFENVDKARAWFSSDAMKQANAARASIARVRLFIVEGRPN